MRHVYREALMMLGTSRWLKYSSLIFSNRDDNSLLLLRFATTLLEQDFYERTSSWYARHFVITKALLKGKLRLTLISPSLCCHNWQSYLTDHNLFLSEQEGKMCRTLKNLRAKSLLVFGLLPADMLDEFFEPAAKLNKCKIRENRQRSIYLHYWLNYL